MMKVNSDSGNRCFCRTVVVGMYVYARFGFGQFTVTMTDTTRNRIYRCHDGMTIILGQLTENVVHIELVFASRISFILLTVLCNLN